MTFNDGWNDESIDVDETITETDHKNADAMGRPPVGKYLCECIDSKPEQVEFKAYSCIGANLKFEIKKPLEVEGKPVDSKATEELVGKIITDTIALYSPLEKEGMKNRRILIAKRMGLISDGADCLTTDMWATGVLGKQVIINFIENSWKDKNTGEIKKNNKVAFDGYDYADKAEVQTQDDFSDI